MYQNLRKQGIPDEHIIYASGEVHGCETRNSYPGESKLTVSKEIENVCNQNVKYSYKDADLTNFQFLDILRGRKVIQFNSYRQLQSDKNSRVLIIISTHGGENFIKVRRNQVILNIEFHRTLNEMYIKERYKELYIILDTCEGYSLYEDVNVPKLFFFSSALVNQKSSSYSFDPILMESTVDRFHYLLYTNLNQNYKSEDKINMPFKEFIESIIAQKDFLGTDPKFDDKVNETVPMSKIFGNPFEPHHKNVEINLKIKESEIKSDINIFKTNYELSKNMHQLQSYAINSRKFTEESYSFKNDINSSNGKNVIVGSIIFGITIIIFIYVSLL